MKDPKGDEPFPDVFDEETKEHFRKMMEWKREKALNNFDIEFWISMDSWLHVESISLLTSQYENLDTCMALRDPDSGIDVYDLESGVFSGGSSDLSLLLMRMKERFPVDGVAPEDVINWARNEPWCRKKLNLDIWDQYFPVPPDYEYFLSLETWNIELAAHLLAGLNPEIELATQEGEIIDPSIPRKKYKYHRIVSVDIPESVRSLLQRLRELLNDRFIDIDTVSPGSVISWAQNTPWCVKNLKLGPWVSILENIRQKTESDAEESLSLTPSRMSVLKEVTRIWLEKPDFKLTRECLLAIMNCALAAKGIDTLHSTNAADFRQIWGEDIPRERKYPQNLSRQDSLEMNRAALDILPRILQKMSAC